MQDMKVTVTGGAGFIGSHLCNFLVKSGCEVTILDNLSASSIEVDDALPESTSHNVRLVIGDCINPRDVQKSLETAEIVFHLAANPEVRLDLCDPQTCFRQNIYATNVLLQQVRKSPNIHTIVFTSTSTIYGDASIVPTQENYGPLKPISLYGASKLACEALLSAYAHTYSIKTVILRLANTIGPQSQHGVIYDFIEKLQENPKKLEILGDGTQTKSYLYITDCIKAIDTALKTTRNQVEICNVGSEDQILVAKIAQIVAEEMKLENVESAYTGGVDGGRGWKGDVKNMLLDITKLKSKGWKPEHNSEQAIRKTIKYLTRASAKPG